MESTNKGILMAGRTLQRILRHYNNPKPIDLSGTKEKKKGAYRNCSKLGHYARECKSRLREQRLCKPRILAEKDV